MPTLTISVPDEGTTVPEGSIIEIDGCSCTYESSTENCTSLGEAVYRMYKDASPSPAVASYNIFSLTDMFYAGIFQGDGGLIPPPPGFDPNAQPAKEARKYRCEALLSGLNLPTNDTECGWEYTCTQKELHFPSFYIEAELKQPPSQGKCTKLTSPRDNVRFLRRDCEHNSTLPHWLTTTSK